MVLELKRDGSLIFLQGMLQTKSEKIENYVKDSEDYELEEIVFGTQSIAPQESLGFVIDEAGAHEKVEEQFIWTDNNDVQIDLKSKNRLKKLKVDFDEQIIQGTEYEERLRSQFQKINPTPSWAKVPDEEIVVDELFQTAGSLLQNTIASINPDKLRMTRLPDANRNEVSNVKKLIVCDSSIGFSSFRSSIIDRWI